MIIIMFAVKILFNHNDYIFMLPSMWHIRCKSVLTEKLVIVSYFLEAINVIFLDIKLLQHSCIGSIINV